MRPTIGYWTALQSRPPAKLEEGSGSRSLAAASETKLTE
jgi:hypothetical protein